MRKLIMLMLSIISISVLLYSCSTNISSQDKLENIEKSNDNQAVEMIIEHETVETGNQTEVATFAGGCFWCLEKALQEIPGVISAVSGYAGGTEENPTYEEVSSGITGHRESVQVTFNPTKITYQELLEHFFTNIDPFDSDGQFIDRGFQYTSAVFYHSEEQKRIADEFIAKLEREFDKPVVTSISQFTTFYPAEDYHQDYYKAKPIRYNVYTSGSGRKERVTELWSNYVWGDSNSISNEETKIVDDDNPVIQNNNEEVVKFTLKTYTDEELKKILTPLQYKVTQKSGTEPPFNNEYWNNTEEGIYVDIVSGEPLFSSTNKYKSGTGWPSFWQPLVQDNIVELEDNTLFSKRTEIRSKIGNSHLGHVFNDGPEPTKLRYCMNSAALRFVPMAEMTKEGYGDYLYLFQLGLNTS